MSPRALAWWLFAPAAAWTAIAAVGVGVTLGDGRAWSPIDRRAAGVEGSTRCRTCHPVEHASWHRSYHRTMTRIAGPDAVAAPFAGERLEHMGFSATMGRAADGTPTVTVTDERGETLLDAEVAFTVGSHHYQQYLAYLDRGGGAAEVWRLPIAWLLGERRYIHLNGAFVEPDGVHGLADDYLRHFSRWNDNCLFCHNTEVSPGLHDGRFTTTVGELGIACESCHGPASAHLERHENPLRRILARGDGDGSIAHPGRLEPRRESAICGRCHGQRIAPAIAAVLAEGDGFLPGTELAAVSRPIFADSRLGDDDDEAPFASRFWPDGTPRLSAYEYQGLLLSPCYGEGEPGRLGCNHCHDMHGDEPDGQLRSGRERAGGCTGCHDPRALVGADRSGGHGGHGPRVDCLDCHMPRIAYGLLRGMITHRIGSPDPGRWVGRHDQPDACTQCHVDRSRRWAAEAMPALGLRGSPPAAEDPREAWAPRVVLDLLGGDGLQRNLAAHALARPGATGHPDARMAALVAALEDDYASVRYFAWQGLRTLAHAGARDELVAALDAYDYLGDPAARTEVATKLRAVLGPAPLEHDPDRRAELEQARDRRTIWIGE